MGALPVPADSRRPRGHLRISLGAEPHPLRQLNNSGEGTGIRFADGREGMLEVRGRRQERSSEAC
ncbi:hypothetical protein GCM10027258_70120 [Amycolatopsis stemonae]